MRLKQFLYLQTVFEMKSMTKASHKLFISHQALSHALRNLEKDYQTTLLKRTPHGVNLTTDGEYVLEIAGQILLLNDQLEKHFVQRMPASSAGSLRVSAVSTFVSYILPQVLVQFIKKYPNISFELLRANVDTIISELCERKIDLGFLSITRIKGQSQTLLPAELIFTPLSHFQYCAIIGNNSPLANYKTLTVKSLLSYPIIFLEEQINNDLENYVPYRIISHYGTPQIIIASSTELFFQLISENIGVSFATLPSFNEIIDDRQLSYKPLRDKIDGHLGYLTHCDDADNAIISKFLDVFSTYRQINYNTSYKMDP